MRSIKNFLYKRIQQSQILQNIFRFCFSIVFPRKSKESCSKSGENKEDICKDIGIVLDKGLGDFLLFAYYLERIVDYYVSQPINRNVSLICNEANKVFLQLCNQSILKKVDIILVKNLEQEEYSFDTIILPLVAISPDVCELLSKIKAKSVISERVDFTGKFGYNHNDIKRIKRIAACDTSPMFYMEHHRNLARALTGEDYGLKHIELQSRDRLINERYYLINNKASNRSKEWSVDKFIKLINLINNKSDILPVIIGRYEDNVLKMFDAVGAECRYANKEILEDTISLCRYAEFVITPDTGIYHIAAFLNKKTVVLSKGCSMKEFIPYPTTCMKNNVLYLFPKENFDTCTRHYECAKCYKANSVSAFCIDSISSEDVFDSIRSGL